jgi:hypothetical protein
VSGDGLSVAAEPPADRDRVTGQLLDVLLR